MLACLRQLAPLGCSCGHWAVRRVYVWACRLPSLRCNKIASPTTTRSDKKQYSHFLRCVALASTVTSGFSFGIMATYGLLEALPPPCSIVHVTPVLGSILIPFRIIGASIGRALTRHLEPATQANRRLGSYNCRLRCRQGLNQWTLGAFWARSIL